MGTLFGSVPDEIVGPYKVDQDRIYLSGLSMAGHGTWDPAA